MAKGREGDRERRRKVEKDRERRRKVEKDRERRTFFIGESK